MKSVGMLDVNKDHVLCLFSIAELAALTSFLFSHFFIELELVSVKVPRVFEHFFCNEVAAL